MGSHQQTSEAETKSEEATCVVNNSGNIVAANDPMCELHKRDRADLLGTDVSTIISEPIEFGRMFETVLHSDLRTYTGEVLCGDGSVVEVQCNVEPTQYDGEICVQFAVTDVAEIKAPENTGQAPFDGFDSGELGEIAKNIRVDAPSGELSLSEIMLDLVVGHNEVEQYKKGALSIHSAVDERLLEEQQRNPGSKECEVLEEVKEAAFGLYLRVQRGDLELHGERGGKHYGYFK